MKFSVCICVYHKDNELYFKESLKSIVNQSLLPNQIVLVVDGYIDKDLQSVIDEFTVQCNSINIIFDVIYLNENVGHGKARRISIDKAKNEIIALMDSDDICDYHRFKKQIKVFEETSDISIVGGQILEIEHDTKKELSKREVPCSDYEIKKYMKTRCPFNQMTVMFRKEAVIKAGGYKDFYHNEDYYLWVRMYLKGCVFHNLEDVLVYARVNSSFYGRRGSFKYFKSEFNLQKIMLNNNIITFRKFLLNVIIRFIIQVLFPSSVRAYIFRMLFRKKV